MNIIESTSWLSDRQNELDSASGKLAALELQLTAAEESFGRTNGNPQEFIAARDRRDHLLHQVEQCKQSVATCQGNVDCAKQGLERAQKLERIEARSTQRATRRTQAAALAREALGHYEQLASTLRQMDALQASDPADVSALRALDQSAYPWFAVDEFLLELMTHAPGCAALAYVSGPSGFRSREYETAKVKGLASVVAPLFEVVAMPPDRVAAYRATLGDSKMLDGLPPVKVEPPARPVQIESVRDSTATCTFGGSLRYRIEKWTTPKGLEHRLILSPLSFMQQGRVMKRETVTLTNQQHPPMQATLITFEGGARQLVPLEQPSVVELTSQAIDRLVGASPE